MIPEELNPKAIRQSKVVWPKFDDDPTADMWHCDKLRDDQVEEEEDDE